MVVAPTRTPSLRSSPWMRTHPHLGFSRPRRMTRSLIAGSSGGRPRVPRLRYVHFLLTSSRCHRSRVWGVTRREDHRSLGSSRLATVMRTRSIRRNRGRPTFRRRNGELVTEHRILDLER